jgi:transcriptional regulator with XRE-family HTH domain
MRGSRAGPTQKRFASLLRDAQTAADVPNDELSIRTGIDATTISRYRNPAYRSGPPSPAKRRLLERALGLLEGYLDGLFELSVPLLREEIRTGWPNHPPHVRPAPSYRVSGTASVEIESGGIRDAPAFNQAYRELSKQIHSAGASQEAIEARIALEWLYQLYQAGARDIQSLRKQVAELRVGAGGDPTLLGDVEDAEQAETAALTRQRKQPGA